MTDRVAPPLVGFGFLALGLFALIAPNLLLLNIDDVALYAFDDWAHIVATWAIRDGRLANLPVLWVMKYSGVVPAGASAYFAVALALSIAAFSFAAVRLVSGVWLVRESCWLGLLAGAFPLMAEPYSFVTAAGQFSMGFLGAAGALLCLGRPGRLAQVIGGSLCGTFVLLAYQPALLLIFVAATVRFIASARRAGGLRGENAAAAGAAGASLVLSVLGFVVATFLFRTILEWTTGSRGVAREIHLSGLFSNLGDYAVESGHFLTATGAFRGVLAPPTMAVFWIAAVGLLAATSRGGRAAVALGLAALLAVALNPMNLLQATFWPTPRAIFAFSVTFAAVVLMATDRLRPSVRDGLRSTALIVVGANLLSIYFARDIQDIRDKAFASRVLYALETQPGFSPDAEVYVGIDGDQIQQTAALSWDLGASLWHYPAQKIALLNFVGGYHLRLFTPDTDPCKERDPKTLGVIELEGRFAVCMG